MNSSKIKVRFFKKTNRHPPFQQTILRFLNSNLIQASFSHQNEEGLGGPVQALPELWEPGGEGWCRLTVNSIVGDLGG